MQTNLTVSGKYITGTLHKLTSGALVDGWGEGYFMALDFSNIPEGATVRVGVSPAQGAGYVELDADHNGAFKVTNKNNQVFKVLTSKDGNTLTDTYYLTTLTLD